MSFLQLRLNKMRKIRMLKKMPAKKSRSLCALFSPETEVIDAQLNGLLFFRPKIILFKTNRSTKTLDLIGTLYGFWYLCQNKGSRFIFMFVFVFFPWKWHAENAQSFATSTLCCPHQFEIIQNDMTMQCPIFFIKNKGNLHFDATFNIIHLFILYANNHINYVQNRTMTDKT